MAILRIFSWVLYDFGSTIFMMNIVSLGFVKLVQTFYGMNDIYTSLAVSATMILSIVLYPVFGSLCDRSNRDIFMLRLLTIISVAATALIPFCSYTAAASLFIIAYLGYQIGLIYYNALLPHLAPGRDISWISGLGIAMRYTGTITGLTVIYYFIKPEMFAGLPLIIRKTLGTLIFFPLRETIEYRNAFIPTSVLFFTTSLPCLIFIRSNKHIPDTLQDFSTFSARIGAIFLSILRTFRQQEARTVFTVNFLVAVPISAVIIYMSVYVTEVARLDAIPFLITATVLSVAGGLFFGLTKYASAEKKFSTVAVLWCGTLLLAGLNIFQPLFWVVGALAGIGMGGYYTLARIITLRIAPVDKRGEYLSCLFIVMALAQIAGPLIWGAIALAGAAVSHTVLSYRFACIILSGFALAGYYLYRKGTV